MSVECASLVSAFLCRNPAERLGADGAAAIKAHPYFNPVKGAATEASDGAGALKGGAEFNWGDLEGRRLKPPIDPMEGLVLTGTGDDRDNTANFDPQFTKLEVDTDVEGEELEQFEHFDGFSFMNESGDFEVGSGDDDDLDADAPAQLLDAEGKPVAKPRKRQSEGDDLQEGEYEVNIDTTAAAAGEQIRKATSGSGHSDRSGSMHSAVGDTVGSLPGDKQPGMIGVVVGNRSASSSIDTMTSWVSDASSLPPPPPPAYPHPDDIVAAEVCTPAAPAAPRKPPRAPLLLSTTAAP